MNKALCNLKEVTVRFKRSEFDIELEWASRCDLLGLRWYAKWISYELASSLVHNLKKSPVNAHREQKLILNCNRFRLTKTATMCELEINWIHTQLEVSLCWCERLHQFFMQSYLARVINWNFVLIVDLVQRTLRILRVRQLLLMMSLVVGAHRYFVSKNINMSLQKWNWFRKNIEASSN
jgi:hypothetical protein